MEGKRARGPRVAVETEPKGAEPEVAEDETDDQAPDGAGEAAVFAMWLMGRGALKAAMWLVVGVMGVWPLLLIATMGMPEWVMGTVFGLSTALIIAISGGYVWGTHARIQLGRDGVLLKQRFESEYVPFADVAEVTEAGENALRLILHSGECVELYTGQGDSGQEQYIDKCDDLLVRLRAGVERARQQAAAHGPAPSAEQLRDRAFTLLRTGQSVEKKTTYRTLPAPQTEELWKVVESTAAQADQRAAAAVLLRHQEGEASRSRLRIATDATVDPNLQKLFRIATDESTTDEADLLTALEHFEQVARAPQQKARRDA